MRYEQGSDTASSRRPGHVASRFFFYSIRNHQRKVVLTSSHMHGDVCGRLLCVANGNKPKFKMILVPVSFNHETNQKALSMEAPVDGAPRPWKKRNGDEEGKLDPIESRGIVQRPG